jgi:hypothetical protein
LLLLSPKASDPRSYHPADPQSKLAEERQAAYDAGQDPRHPAWIKILRFYAAIRDLLNSEDPIHAKMAFNFYDYDNNGNIGSVDITNLKRHFHLAQPGGAFDSFEALLTAFEEERVQRNIKTSFQYVLKGTERKALIVREKPKRKEYNKSNQDLNVTRDSPSGSSDDEESESDASQYEHMDESTRALMNPWNRFLVELQSLRNHFVDEAILPQTSLVTQDFLDFKQYEQKLLPVIEQKYAI